MKGKRRIKGIFLGAALAAAVLAAGGCHKAETAAGEKKPAGEQWPVTSAEEERSGGKPGETGGDEEPVAAGGDEEPVAAGGEGAEAEGGEAAGPAGVRLPSTMPGGIPGAVLDGTAAAGTSAAATLPPTGRQLSDFVPDGWILMDSVTLDFNEDGIADYVGVLECRTDTEPDPDPAPDPEYRAHPFQPRILFAAASDGTGSYRLDFTDVNLIRTAAEGGTFGDPYLPMTAQGQSFTINSYGGSSWKWSESDTYTYKNSTWYLTAAEYTGSFSGYITEQSIDDYVKGIGIRHKRSSDFEEIEKHLMDTDWENPVYDLTYEVRLDPPITLYQAGMRSFLSPERQTDYPVEAIVIAEGMDQKKTPVMLPGDQYNFRYLDEDCLIYSYMDINDEIWYLALYGRKNRTLSVIAQEGSPIDDIIRYKDNIYYTAEIKGQVYYKEYSGNVRRTEEQVGVKLIRINVDGTDSREIFSYELPEWKEKVLETSPPFLFLSTEISGEEIFTEVYIDGSPHPFYRMNPDGSGLQMIGTVPKE